MSRPDSLCIFSLMYGNSPMLCCAADRRWVSPLVAVVDPSSVGTKALLSRRLESQATLAGSGCVAMFPLLVPLLVPWRAALQAALALCVALS